MDAENPTPCLICGKELKSMIPEHAPMMPGDAVVFSASGNYGSCVFDEEDGSVLAGNICDDCVIVAYKQGRLTRMRMPVCHHDAEIIEWNIEER